jgi:hypothetical protein
VAKVPIPLRQETSDQQPSGRGRATTPAQRVRSIRSPTGGRRVHSVRRVAVLRLPDGLPGERDDPVVMVSVA